MIQRIQTVYLLAAAVLVGLMLVLPIAWFFGDGAEFRLMAYSFEELHADAAQMLISTLYLGILLTVSAFVPFVTLFLYKNRILQLRLCFAEVVLLLGSLFFVGYYIYNLSAGMEVYNISDWKLGLAAVFPVIGMILVILAIRAIARDERLVRSLDRIR